MLQYLLCPYSQYLVQNVKNILDKNNTKEKGIKHFKTSIMVSSYCERFRNLSLIEIIYSERYFLAKKLSSL